MYTYIKCIIGLSFMLALAPIFIILILFQRTYKLFEGWLSMVINFALQPILMFAFLGLFIAMITASLQPLLEVRWCLRWFWATVPIVGLPYPAYWLRPVEVPGGMDTFDGMKDFDVGDEYPLSLMNIMFFLLAAYLGKQYAQFVPQLSNQLSQGGLHIGASMDDVRNYFRTKEWSPEQVTGNLVSKTNSFFR
jgi:type IV secretory pathway VirB6-like protein